MIEIMIQYLWTFVGTTPYKLGGNVIQDGGLDCSALVLEGLRAIGKWGMRDATANDIYEECHKLGSQVPNAQKGDLLFFGKQRVVHVAVALNDRLMIEAGGTDKNGMVRIRPIGWRSDLKTIVRISE